VRYPEKDHAPEAELLKRIEAALRGAPSVSGASESTAPQTAEPDAGAAGPTTADTGAGSVAPDAGTGESTATNIGEAVSADASESNAGAPALGQPDSKGPDARTKALIALLEAAGLLGKLFPDVDKSWADELAKDYWPARAVENELLMIRLAQAEAPTL